MVSLERLNVFCSIVSDRLEANTYILRFRFGNVQVTMRITFGDQQSGAEMVIVNMTTLPKDSRGAGVGSIALRELLSWACQQGFQKILATQVQRESETFWTKNGFVKLGNITNDFEYVRTL